MSSELTENFEATLTRAYGDFLVSERTPTNTVAARMRALRSLRQVADPGTATREDVELWWSLRGEADIADSTRANDLACLRAFYKWCQLYEHRASDPTIRIASPKVAPGLPRPATRDELRRILAATPPDLRRAVALGAYGGLRVSEAAALDWADVDLEHRRMLVVGKGGKQRWVAMGALLLDELGPPNRSGAGNVVSRETPYSAPQLQRKVNRAIKEIGVDVTFHQLRHRYGTLAYQATGDLLAVGRQMGHTSPATTAIYAAASDEVADVIAEAVTR